jgi:hypothetical protein
LGILNLTNKTRVVSHCGLAITLTCILRQKRNHENSNISPCKNTIFQKSSQRNQNSSRYLSLKEGSLFCLVVMDASDHVLGVFGKLSMRRVHGLGHDVWTSRAKVLEY